MTHGKLAIAFTLIGAIILGVIALFFIQKHYFVPTAAIPQNHIQPKIKIEKEQPINSKFTIPNSFLLPVPFTPQAPSANWDELHNEACEEAAAIMSYAYFGDCPLCHSGLGPESTSKSRLTGQDIQTNLPTNFVESEISKLTNWQDDYFGYHLDTTSAETAKMISEKYKLQTKLIENFTSNDIKNELTQNHLVIISENGQKLGNPFYKQPGPIHHMLLIKGFTETEFIANDSGTIRGLNYPYSFTTIYQAAADWDHARHTVDENRKIMIAVWK